MSQNSTSLPRKTALALAVTLSASFMPSAHAGSESYVGELFLFAGNFCPRNTLPAAGQTLAISQNTALFSLLGTTYGGDGQITFRLPDLQGRVPVGTGSGPGLYPTSLGQIGGTETQALTPAQMPMHTHTAVVTSGVPARTQEATHATPAPGRMLAQAQNAGIYRETATADVTLGNSANVSVGVAGGSQPFSIRDPYLSMQWCIVVDGIYPPRP
jgi:microcystin-dependent protein